VKWSMVCKSHLDDPDCVLTLVDMSNNPIDADEGFPLSNVLNYVRDYTFRYSNPDPFKIRATWTLGLLRPVDFVGMPRHNMHGANIAWEFFSDEAWTDSIGSVALHAVNWWSVLSGGHDFGVRHGRSVGNDPFLTEAQYRTWLPALLNVGSLEITFTNLGGLSNYTTGAAEISRLYVGNKFTSRNNPKNGAPFGITAIGESARSTGGQARNSESGQYESVTYEWERVTPEEYFFWRDFRKHVGKHGDVITSMFPTQGDREERDTMHHGVLSFIDPLGRQSMHWTNRIQIEGV
jgi:hypothetical protein